MRSKNHKSKLIIIGYEMRKNQHEGFKIIKFFRYENENFSRKKTIYKHLTLSDAESILYKLESQIL